MHRAISFLSLITALLLAFPDACEAASADGKRVRVTTGSYEVAGWETNLVRGNPNLRHFTWVPITSFVQGSKTIRQVKGPDLDEVRVSRPERKPIYVKPIHIPTVIVKKPPENTLNGRLRVPEVSGNLRVTQVTGRLQARDVSAKLAAANVKGQIRPGQDPGAQKGVSAKLASQLEEKAVSGRIQPPTAVAVYPAYGVSEGLTDSCLKGSLGSKSVYGRIRGCRSF